jgi:hypothetical protein
MIDAVFDKCVELLVFLANQLGMTYEAINVWIFVIIWPIFTLALIVLVILQQLKIRRLLGQAGKREDSTAARE